MQLEIRIMEVYSMPQNHGIMWNILYTIVFLAWVGIQMWVLGEIKMGPKILLQILVFYIVAKKHPGNIILC